MRGSGRLFAVPLALTIFADAVIEHAITGVMAVVAMVALVAILVWEARAALRPSGRARRRKATRSRWWWLVLLLPLVFLAARVGIAVGQLGAGSAEDFQGAARDYDVAFLVLGGAAWTALRPPRMLVALLSRLLARPALLLATSFAGLISAGTLLLILPVSVRRVVDVSFVDSLFTVTSAVCVTGLTVNEPGVTYTFFGQLVILGALQLGGIGIMTIAALVPLLMGDRSLREQARYARVMDVRSLGDLRSTVLSILIATFSIEAIGALVLWLRFQGDTTLGYPVWFAVFHSISAFCNAGISVFRGNLLRFSGDPVVQAVIATLIILGGIGFPVLAEAGRRLASRFGRVMGRGEPVPPRWTLGSRTALRTSALLLVGGAVVIGALEARGAFASLGWGKGFFAALFTSVTARTAGFSTVDVGTFSDTSLLVLIVLMFVGGSPGSTAGGVKTTTLAVIVAAFRAEIRGGEPRLGGRTLPEGAVRRATAVMASAIAIILFAMLSLSLTEHQSFERIAFEAVSAFGTVGLSTGITPELSTPGKLVLALTMFVGRVGPLTVALAVGQAVAGRRFRPAREDLPIG